MTWRLIQPQDQGCGSLEVIGVARTATSPSGGSWPSPPVVTAAQMVAGHVTLDISCLDRIYLPGFVAKLQAPAAVV
jgi:hypothetical protein